MRSYLKRLSALLLVFVMISALCPAAAASEQASADSSTKAAVNHTANVSAESKLLEQVTDTNKLRAYLAEKMADCETNIDISQFRIPGGYDYVYALNSFISYGMPESFHFKSAVIWGNLTFCTRIAVSYCDFADTKAEYEAANIKFKAAADSLLDGVENNSSLTDVEKALILHDRLIVRSEYDESPTIAQSSYSAYGALVERKSVCQGYALAYAYLLDRAGVPSYYCASYLLSHGWNIVYIGGKPYHVDVAWDDPTPDEKGYVCHDNFLRSSNGIAETGHAVRGTDYDTTPDDTTYDNSYWQDSLAEFQLIDDKLYYFDNTKNNLCCVKNSDNKVIASCVGDCTSKLDSNGKDLFLSTAEEIYKYDLGKNAYNVFYSPKIPNTGYYQISGFEYTDGKISCDIFTGENGADYMSVKILEGVTEIEAEAFKDCAGLMSVELPSSLKTVGDGAFYGCCRLTELEIPKGTEYIGERAFYNCTALKTILIPESVRKIGDKAFGYFCDSSGSEKKIKDFSIKGFSETVSEQYAADNGLDFVIVGKGQAHIHIYSSKVIEAPTCNKSGVRRYICSCGETYNEKIPTVDHTKVTDKAEKATCTKDGKTRGAHCSVCGKVLVQQKTVKATGHKYVTVASHATFSKDGKTEKKCSLCGKTTLSKINRVSSVSLSKTSFVYNGKTQKPSVTVRNSKGTALKNGVDYTLSYSNGSKYVGRYTVTVTLIGKYSGKKTLSYNILPKGTSVSKLTAGRKKFTTEWNKQSTQTTGYELQYSSSASMKDAKKVRIGDSSSTLKAIKNLKSNKKYFVRVRTYKTVKINGESVKLYSAWSEIKSVRTKK